MVKDNTAVAQVPQSSSFTSTPSSATDPSNDVSQLLLNILQITESLLEYSKAYQNRQLVRQQK